MREGTRREPACNRSTRRGLCARLGCLLAIVLLPVLLPPTKPDPKSEPKHLRIQAQLARCASSTPPAPCPCPSFPRRRRGRGGRGAIGRWSQRRGRRTISD